MKELRRLRRQRSRVGLEKSSVYTHIYPTVWKALGFISGRLGSRKARNSENGTQHKRETKITKACHSNTVADSSSFSKQQIHPHGQRVTMRTRSSEAVPIPQSHFDSQNPTLRVSKSGLRSYHLLRHLQQVSKMTTMYCCRVTLARFPTNGYSGNGLVLHSPGLRCESGRVGQYQQRARKNAGYISR